MDALVSALENRSLTQALAEQCRNDIDTSQPDVAQRVIPAVLDFLVQTPTSYDAGSDVQRTRQVLLELLHKFPLNDHVKPLASQIVSALLKILPTENEEAGVLCVKLLLELNRFYKEGMEEHAVTFLNLLIDMYGSMQATVDEAFAPDAASEQQADSRVSQVADALAESTLAAAATPTTPTAAPRRLALSSKSFKVSLECPLVVVIVFQTYRPVLESLVAKLVEVVVDALQVQPLPQKLAHARAAAQPTDSSHDGVFVGVAPEITNRQLYTEFITCQVKALSFLAFLVKGFPAGCAPFHQRIPPIVVSLLKNVPPESASPRKELLVATRHILSTDARSHFLSVLDDLLHERVLVGEGITGREHLRPLGLSMLADLLHNMRFELTVDQLHKSIATYSRIMLDYRLPPSVHSMCVKLLANMVEVLQRSMDRPLARQMTMRIMEVFAAKCESLASAFPAFMKAYDQKRVVLDEHMEHVPDCAEDIDFDQSRPIPVTPMPEPEMIRQGAYNEIRLLIRNIMQFMRTIITGLRLTNPPTNLTSLQHLVHGFNQEDASVFIRLLQGLIKCFDYYAVDLLINPPQPTKPKFSMNDISKSSNDIILTRFGPHAKEEKEMVEHLCLVFLHVDPALFNEVFSTSMDLLFDRMLVNTTLLAIPQYFLGNEVTSKRMATIMLRYLSGKLDAYGGSDPLLSAVMLRLFKYIFMAVTLFPDENEMVLHPYLTPLITSCMKLPAKAKEPINYYLLLRALFRSIGGGRFERLYKEVLPLLQALLDGFQELLATTHKRHMRELFVELSLTIPVRLSVLLPYLKSLMQPLVLSLQGGPEQLSQGLRTFELCIDNLNPDFLDPILAPYIDDLMRSLWKQLRPLPYNQNFAHATMRILGKLGGRNRQMLRDRLTVQPKVTLEVEVNQPAPTEDALDIILPFHAALNNQEMALDSYVYLAVRVLSSDSYDEHYQAEAFDFVQSCLSIMLGVENVSDEYADRLTKYIVDLQQQPSSVSVGSPKPESPAPKSFSTSPHPLRSRFKQEAQEMLYERVLFAHFIATSAPGLADRAKPVLERLVQHFALVKVCEVANQHLAPETSSSKLLAKTEASFGSNTFLNTVVSIMTSESSSWRGIGETAIELFYQTCLTLLKDRDKVAQLPAFHYLASRLCASCFQQQWFKKSGGCSGISVLASRLDLGRAWMLEHELEFVRSLLYLLKNQSSDLPSCNIEEATQTLSHVLKTCNRPDDADEDQDAPRFNALVALLTSELSSSSDIVRETVQQSFQLLADLTGNEVTELLTSARERLLAPIFAKPLRALPMSMQIGHIDAITYCMSLRPPLLTFNDELLRLLHEALALADAEEPLPEKPPLQHQAVKAMAKLRTVCLRLLSSAMACSEFQAPTLTNTRSRIISVFFKSLYNKSQEVIDAASKGLQLIMAQQQRIPKDLLQNGLRPILATLSDHSKMTVTGLEGLAHVLELLVNYFKVEIGHKLLDQMRCLPDKANMEEVTGQPINDNMLGIMAALTDLFPLLPTAAMMFMDDLVQEILRYEGLLRRTVSSPFRRTLLRYLGRFPEEAVNYFFDRLQQYNYSRLFLGLLKIDEALVLHTEIMRNPDKLIAKTFAAEGESSEELHLQGALIVREICEHNVDWLVQNSAILQHLRDMWRRFVQRPPESAIAPARAQECICLLNIFLACLKRDPLSSAVLLDVLDVFSVHVVVDLSFVRQVLIDEVVMKATSAQRAAMLRHALSILASTEVRTLSKVQYLRILIVPSLTLAFARHSMDEYEVLDLALLEDIQRQVWAADDLLHIYAPYHDDLLIELMQLTSLIVQFRPKILEESKLSKDIVKFAWNFITAHDVTARHAAYSLMARFITVFETQTPVTSQIYQALLKTTQSEVRQLVRHSLNLLLPVIPLRMDVSAADGKHPAWTLWTSKVITEEGNSIQQLVTVTQLLLRHRQVFLPHRALFAPVTIQALPRLGFHPNTSTAESRQLSIDLAELMLEWVGGHHPEGDVDMTDVSSIAAAAADDTAVAPVALPDSLKGELINYLVRFACSFSAPAVKRGSVHKCMQLLKDVLPRWRNIEFSYAPVEKALQQPVLTEESAAFATRALDILCMDMERLQAAQLAPKFPALRQILLRCLRYEQGHLLVPPLQTLLVGVLKLSNAEAEAVVDGTVFRRELETIVSDALQTQASSSMVVMLAILTSLGTVFADDRSSYIPNAVKMLQKLTRDHLQVMSEASAQAQSSTAAGERAATAPDAEHDTTALQMALQLMYSWIDQLGDQRRWLMSALATLIDKSTDIKLCRFILDLVAGCVRDTTGPLPTLKEKAQLLSKMLELERKGDTVLFEDYLKLIAELYANPVHAGGELTHRLEPVFMIGLSNSNPTIRRRFFESLDASLSRALYLRLHFLLGIQNWEHLAAHLWIHQALDLLLGAVEYDKPINAPRFVTRSASLVQLPSGEEDAMAVDSAADPADEVRAVVSAHIALLQNCQRLNTAGHMVRPLQQLQHLDETVAGETWGDLFALCWRTLSPRDQTELTKALVSLLTKDYHMAQMNMRPNVMQILLQGIAKCSPPPKLPPHVTEYLGRTYNAWHTSAEILLQGMLSNQSPHTTLVAVKDEERYHDMASDAFCDLMELLGEEDVFYGTWRRRCQYPETNIAISYEQLGMWIQAQSMLEQAQIKGRTGTLPFNESEFCLWEDQWVLCSQKLQYWDILEDLSRSEANPELALECAWRLRDWTAIGRDKDDLEALLGAATELPSARRKVLEAFIALNKLADQREIENQDRINELFQKTCDEGVQLALQQWFTLPEAVGLSHIPLLQLFQQFVELGEALQIYVNLANTNLDTYESRFAELKGILQTWRERLPNMWDDINVWSDLVAWRQHIFGAINRAYNPLLNLPLQPQNSDTGSGNTFAYRGYHETAWIVNRFAHVARSHKLTSVCMNYLPKIYTLPNIEIVEAFLKLKEQCKCYLENPGEYIIALDVINNTNMVYFDKQQKAEFYALKGRFLAYLGHADDADRSFATAVSTEIHLPKAWAAWGMFQDKIFKDDPEQIDAGCNALLCFLQAAGLYNNGRSRKYLARVLWLLSMDNEQGSMMQVFESYRGETPLWYWITFIPQLLTTLSASHPQSARSMLHKIARMYPQALYYMLRTTKEDLTAFRRQQPSANSSTSDLTGSGAASNKDEKAAATKPEQVEIVDEITVMLKTGSPLLALSMETMIDQVIQRLKPLPDEEMYRYIVALLNDFVHQLLVRVANPDDDLQLNPQSQIAVRKFADTISSKYKEQFEEDFIKPQQNLVEFVGQFRRWRDHLEVILDNQTQRRHLEHLSHYLIEFDHQRFDDIEVPGQYLLNKDNAQDFIRIDRFLPDIERIRGDGNSYRRIVIRGHDGSLHPFRVQQPASRNYRKEERVFQLFRMFNSILERKKETRKRNVHFHLPIIVPLTPTVRIIADDTTAASLQDVYEDYCSRVGMHKDGPFIFFADRVRAVITQLKNKERTEALNVKVDVLEEIRNKLVPEDILSKYLKHHVSNFTDLWMLRKVFTTQMAAVTFMTFVLNIGLRFPRSIHISRSKGSIWLSECLPSFAPQTLLLSNFESVPFRLTPNLQHFITPVHLDGLFSTSLLAIAQGLTDPATEMEDYLGIFLRDEIMAWMTQAQRSAADVNIKDKVLLNVRAIISRAQMLACRLDKEKDKEKANNANATPLNQPILDLISQATNPQKLALMDVSWMPFF
ncbi:transcription-associated protein 1 [Sorochytrium milnesiophthora]